jgi:hypothetical protein
MVFEKEHVEISLIDDGWFVLNKELHRVCEPIHIRESQLLMERVLLGFSEDI